MHYAACSPLPVRLLNVLRTRRGGRIIDTELGEVTKVGHSAFANCTGMTSAILKNVTSIGASAFKGCTSLGAMKLGAVSEVDSTAFDGMDTESCTLTFYGTPAAGELDRNNKMWCNKKWKTINII